ncbi:hypothetical protein V6N13_032148 [Hibiscus sabdariffa]
MYQKIFEASVSPQHQDKRTCQDGPQEKANKCCIPIGMSFSPSSPVYRSLQFTSKGGPGVEESISVADQPSRMMSYSSDRYEPHLI